VTLLLAAVVAKELRGGSLVTYNRDDFLELDSAISG
jgi:hypothetical protein